MYFVLGTEDLNMTVTGDLTECELNAPTAIGVSQNRTIYVATLTDLNPDSYNFSANSSLYQMPTFGQCYDTCKCSYITSIQRYSHQTV